MLLVKSKKALLLRLRNPSKVTTVIPKSKVVTYKGKEFVAVKHGVDEVKVLRNLGFNPPDPIKYYYSWPGRFKPFLAQRETAAVETLGPVLESHERFPERANIGFMQVVKREHIRLRVYERGAGETQACGSGACAAVAVGISQGLLAEEVRVELPGGRLDIAWKGPGHPLYMTGPAAHVYDGFIHL